MSHAGHRLTSDEVQAILSAARSVLGDKMKSIYLFGSRANINKKGGDIDLWIECASRPAPIRDVQSALRLKIWDQIGEQKIDIQLSGPLDQIQDPSVNAFVNEIQSTWIRLDDTKNDSIEHDGIKHDRTKP